MASPTKPSEIMPHTAAPKAVEPTTKVRTAVAILTAIVVFWIIGRVAKVVAILIVIVYIAIDIVPAINEPVKQLNGLGNGFSGGVLFIDGRWEMGNGELH
jgi:hypothetical protein